MLTHINQHTLLLESDLLVWNSESILVFYFLHDFKMNDFAEDMATLIQKKAELEKSLGAYDERKIHGQIKSMFDALRLSWGW